MAKKRKLVEGSTRRVVMINERLHPYKVAMTVCGTLHKNQKGDLIFTDNEKETKITIMEMEGEKEEPKKE